MSQIFKTDLSSPLANIETITGNTGGAVGPDLAFNLNLIGTDGIIVKPSSTAPNTLVISETTGFISTVGVASADVLTIPLGAVQGTYIFDIRLAMTEPATGLGGAYTIQGGMRTTGALAALIGAIDFQQYEDAALITSDFDLITFLNSAVVTVTGVAGRTLNWKCAAVWTFVS